MSISTVTYEIRGMANPELFRLTDIVHGDIKPHNVLIFSRVRGNIQAAMYRLAECYRYQHTLGGGGGGGGCGGCQSVPEDLRIEQGHIKS